ncbi:hypothetical protein CPC16_001597 [Podila verticillata]|nr:hypothetical protein CPC16_001597 [Podila verticillata]
MIATVVSPGSIPDFVHPPVPGESHDLYGDSHLDSIKLPAPSVIPSSSNNYTSSSSALFSDPLSHSVNTNSSSPNNHSDSQQTSTQPTIGGVSVRELDSVGAIVDEPSDAISWSKLVEACTLGHADVVQEIIAISPALKDSIDNVSSATGMNPLHFAASRGHSEVVRILIDQAGAGVDIQDREGETALLKASYSGSLPTVCFLLKRGANVHQRDKDGWTALHNASSRGYIDIAQVLLEKGEADINARSKMGHSPLINAASKGDVAMALYFLNHANAKPFLKNNFSEAAYDVAAANSEAYLCDILQSSEKQWWKVEHPNDQQYDVQATHNTVLLVVHENQRAVGSFPLSFMAPKFAASALLQQDFCGPWSLPNGRPSTKDDVHLPLLTGGSSTKSNTQRGWFWLTEWVVDKTDPNVDSDGWQYGKSLTEPNQVWTANAPTSGGNWVRRRKWIRVMKKRVDMDKTASSDDPLIDDLNLDVPETVNEQGDYIKRAGLALRAEDGFSDDHQELSRYRQAIQILLRGIKADKNMPSKSAATTLVQEYLEHSEQLSETIENHNAAYRSISDLETPMPQIASPSTQGNPGSPNELRRLTLLKSRPSDTDVLDALQDHSTSLQVHANPSEPELPSSIDNVPEEHHQTEEHPPSSQEQELSSLEQAFESSSLEPSSEVPVSEAAERIYSHQASEVPLTEPLATIPQDRQDTNTSSTPIISDPFPMARLTRSSRATPSSSSSSSNTPSVSAPPPQHFEQHQAAISASSPVILSSSLESQHETSLDARESPQTSPATVSTSALPQATSNASNSINTPHRSQSSQSPSQHHHHHQSVTHMIMGPLPGAKWESDYKAIECRECHRKFSLWLRRHHCRRCGHVVCDRCSSHRATLHPSMVVYDPSSSEAFITHQTMSRRGTLQSYRVCDSCYSTLGPVRSQSMGSGSGSASSSAVQTGSHISHHRSYQGQSRHNDHHNNNGNNLSSSPFDNGGVYLSNHSGYTGDYGAYSSSRSSSSSNIHQPTPMVRNASSSSLMSECPVCGAILAGLEGGKAAQEAHVQDCLEGKPGQGSGPINNVRYIVYKLPADSPLIDQECAICFEEFVAGA